MCRSCYHQMGNSKQASKCAHKNKPNYAKGMCKNCYLSYYYESKLKQQRAIKKQKSQTAATAKAGPLRGSKKSAGKASGIKSLEKSQQSSNTNDNTPHRP